MSSWRKNTLTRNERSLILRNGLVELIDRCVSSPLTLMLAPAGSGKTTALQQWRTMRPEHRVVNLSMGSAHADPVHFFRYWLEAMREQVPEFDTFSYNQLVADAALPASVVAESLLHSFESVAQPLIVVLDDFQYANGTLIEQVFDHLITRLPKNIHLLIVSRVQPGFALGKLQLESSLAVIDREDLDFHVDDLRALASMMLGHDLQDHEINYLMGVTEGWIAGVRFALLAQEHHPQPSDATAFDGRHPGIIDYFAQVVLRDLPDDERDLLLAVSIVDRFSAPLCQAMTGRSDAARIIESLISRELFIQPLGDKPGWYRFHGLFQEFLRNRLLTDAPEMLPKLHRCAAQWLCDEGEYEAALQHAHHCHDDAWFTSLLEQCCDRWSKKGDFPSVLRWLVDFPEEQLLRNTDLGFPLIAALILSRKFNQARYYLDLFQETPRDDASGRLVDDSNGPFLEVMLQLFQQETHFRLSADRAALMDAVSHRDMRAFSLAILAYHHYLRAEFSSALGYAQRAKDILAQLGYEYLESYADLILVQCDRHAGRMLQSMQLAQNAFFRHDKNDRYSPAWVNAATAIAVVRYEQNMLGEAQRLCEELVPLVSASCATEIITAAYLTLVRVLHIGGYAGRAQRLMLHLERVLQLGVYDRFMGQLAHESMRQAFITDATSTTTTSATAVNRVAEHYQLDRRLARGGWDHPLGYDESWERYGLATALWLRACDELNEASQLLGKLAVVLRRDRVMARLVVVEANQAVLLSLQGRQPQAIEWLRRIIEEHGVECVNRTVFDEAPGLSELMVIGLRQGVIRVPTIYISMFADLLEEQEPAVVQAAETIAVPTATVLTQRETEILTLLRQGLSNQAISDRTGVALSTIKWHLKNIFAKLGVSSRAEAIVLDEL
ncbi:MAG: hypothetical protein CVV10_01690 [Gammaproteobacteria bacterium HGW-Gammaproteobacteria-14]|nr:MAG: hypothetical protein CVV10_01690 [Gammaproteobacteria bacterium HGW-Gammaproteobacteria-14]